MTDGLNQFAHILGELVGTVNNFLWTYILIAALILLGLWFTYKTKFVQIRCIPEMFRLIGEGVGSLPREGHISTFQAFCVSTASRVGVGNIGKIFKKGEAGDGEITPLQAVSTALASTVGTGNIAGVTGAIILGGPGAVFWMWVIATIGAASGFVESTLAQIYKVKRPQGGFAGGPAYYIRNVIGSPFFAGLFAVYIFGSIEAFYFACKLSLEKRCIEMSNRSCSTNPIHKIFPEFGNTVANGSNGAETCYYNSF